MIPDDAQPMTDPEIEAATDTPPALPDDQLPDLDPEIVADA